MRSAGWPLPSVIAGSLRSLIGKQAAREFSEENGQTLLALHVAGGLPRSQDDGTLYLPAPHDCVVHSETNRLFAARPQELQAGDGCDLPYGSLLPVMLSQSDVSQELKPRPTPAWWPAGKFTQWMLGQLVDLGESFLAMPKEDQRTHVKIDPKNGTSPEGMLFSTTSLALAYLRRHGADASRDFAKCHAKVQLAVRVRGDGWCGQAASQLDALHPLGGERRLAEWKTVEKLLWCCPPEIAQKLAGAQRVRMVLATPAIFSGGWKPGWLNGDLIGTPPGTELKLKLAGVCIGRWQAVSGWSLAHPRGPKPIRRMVPAGGVYFFELVSGNAQELAKHWLEPVSDRENTGEQECRDGFGLATWGIW